MEWPWSAICQTTDSVEYIGYTVMQNERCKDGIIRNKRKCLVSNERQKEYQYFARVEKCNKMSTISHPIDSQLAC